MCSPPPAPFMSTLEMEAEYDAIQQTYAAEKNRCISIMEQAEVVIAENIAQMPQDLPPIEQGLPRSTSPRRTRRTRRHRRRQ